MSMGMFVVLYQYFGANLAPVNHGVFRLLNGELFLLLNNMNFLLLGD